MILLLSMKSGDGLEKYNSIKFFKDVKCFKNNSIHYWILKKDWLVQLIRKCKQLLFKKKKTLKLFLRKYKIRNNCVIIEKIK